MRFTKMIIAACAMLIAMPAMAQNTTPPNSTDLVKLSRQDANGVGTNGAVSVATLFNVAGVGYSTGGGGAVTQITSRTTGVTLNKLAGQITLVSAAGSTTPATFTVTNSTVGVNDVVLVVEKSGTDTYTMDVTAVAAGSFNITSNTKTGTTTESPVFSFVVIKGAAS